MISTILGKTLLTFSIATSAPADTPVAELALDKAENKVAARYYLKGRSDRFFKRSTHRGKSSRRRTA